MSLALPSAKVVVVGDDQIQRLVEDAVWIYWRSILDKVVFPQHHDQWLDDHL
jgi:hypothetical protein